jgi:hypothetical protein
MYEALRPDLNGAELQLSCVAKVGYNYHRLDRYTTV